MFARRTELAGPSPYDGRSAIARRDDPAGQDPGDAVFTDSLAENRAVRISRWALSRGAEIDHKLDLSVKFSMNASGLAGHYDRKSFRAKQGCQLPAFDNDGLLPPGDHCLTIDELHQSMLVVGPKQGYPDWDVQSATTVGRESGDASRANSLESGSDVDLYWRVLRRRQKSSLGY